MIGQCAAIEGMAPVLCVDFDLGTRTIKGTATDVVLCSNMSRFREVIAYLNKPNPYRTLALDDINELYMLMMAEQLRLATGKPGHEPDIPWQEDWMRCTTRIRKLLRQLRLMPMNLICTTTEQITVDVQTEVMLRTPEMPGKLAGQISKFFDVTGRLDRVGEKYVCQLEIGKGAQAKNRDLGLGRQIEGPDMMRAIFAAHMKGGGKEAVSMDGLTEAERATPSPEE